MSADARAAAKTRIPTLRNGQRLTRSEFMRRWEAMPELKRAERIEGRVSLMSPRISLDHSDPHSVLIWCLMTYRMATPGVRSLNETTVHIDGDNDLQPDVGLFIDPNVGGQTRYVGSYPAGAPELVVEVAETTASRDLGPKFEVYRRAGVLEYLVWETRKKSIHAFVNQEGQFKAAKADESIFRSKSFPGLWLDLAAMTADELAKVQSTLAAGLNDPAHAKFKRKLARAKKS
jgi:Uma2 family endonuclease